MTISHTDERARAREVRLMLALEKLAAAIGADWGEWGHTENPHLLSEARTIFEVVGMTDEGDGYGFDWTAEQDAIVEHMGGRSFALIDPAPIAFATEREEAAILRVGDGWRAVPIEPTYAMRKAGDDEAPFFLGVTRVWSAMLAAAPAPGDPQ